MTGRPRGRPRKYPLPVSKPIEQVQDEHVDIQNISPRQILFKLKTPFEESTFGGLLTPEQADRTDTTPTTKDQKLFEHSLVAVIFENNNVLVTYTNLCRHVQ